jgi:hypothetical protein
MEPLISGENQMTCTQPINHTTSKKVLIIDSVYLIFPIALQGIKKSPESLGQANLGQANLAFSTPAMPALSPIEKSPLISKAR